MGKNFSIETTLCNGNTICLYMDTYGTRYVVTAFTCDYRVLKTRKTKEYSLALHYFKIFENQYGK